MSASAPGWYPDPDGRGGQRYFDGTNWGPTAPAATAPPPQKKPLGCFKTVALIIGVLFLIGLVSNSCDDDKKEDSSSSSRSSSSVRASTTSRTPTTSAGPVKPEANFAVEPDGSVTAAFAIGDNLTEGLIKDGARFRTIDILEYAKKTYPNASQVTVQGSFPMKDAYGNVSTDVVVNVTYLKSTIDQINFEGVDKDNIWEIRDSGFVHPEFQP